jgi:hypothetical protein
MLVGTAKADGGVNHRSQRASWSQKEPDSEVDADRWPRGTVKIESKPRHENRQNN